MQLFLSSRVGYKQANLSVIQANRNVTQANRNVTQANLSDIQAGAPFALTRVRTFTPITLNNPV